MAETKRKRRDAAAARTEILDAAEKRLVLAGPGGIRLQEVAADAGVSHPTVLHHFGSREALVDAVVERALQAIHARLVEALQKSRGEEAELAAMLDAVFDALAGSGHARVLLWIALEGRHVTGGEVPLSAVVDATHALRKSKHGRKKPPPREDTAHLVVLASLALVGLPVLGPKLLRNSGLENDADSMRRFRAFLAKVILRQFAPPPET
ncbi:TetR/AcrR family transcriptional regulator [Pyxidicoccus fallax]|uniref:TetR/AcrR family transcriptional regulator n=1 Tax=Pyxidicoccus fallax TaxID=394095 RepID=A0A848LEZ5_9BACT|nr:TetR/AcrR family transcriptional regulator [Pyxidicoccus fallax]NMO15483.1 TetR/AcrR family transcriptional regulator [Pyxidicoccus fallax]NPC80325.1 TetR/AcrR family transcriptional regulator [Pyxidicoccus fallax]